MNTFLSLLFSFSICILPLNSGSDIPLKHCSDLKEYHQISDAPHDSTDVVIIYTFLECKPCLKLAKDLQKDIVKNSLSKKSLIYFNTFNTDTSRMKKYLGNLVDIVPYYYSKSPMMMEGTYPKISFYDSLGNLDTTLFGYSKESYQRIVKKLRAEN